MPIEIVPPQPPNSWVKAAFSPDGARIISADGQAAKLWDAASGRLMRVFVHTSAVYSVAFSPDGSRIVSGSADKTAKLWDAATGRLLQTFVGHTSNVVSVAFSPNGTRIASGSLDTFSNGVPKADDKTIKIWDAASGRLLITLSGHKGHVWSVAFSPDGTRIVSASADKTLKLWDAATGRLLRTFTGHTDGVQTVAFSPDGSRIVSGSQDKTAKLWDAATGQLLLTFVGHAGPLDSVAFSPDGVHLLSGVPQSTAGGDNTVKLWNASGQLLRTFQGRPAGSSVAFSPDGGRVLSGGYGRMTLWDAASGDVLQTFGEGLSSSRSAALSPDGTSMLSAGSDGTVRLWDAATGQLLRTFTGHTAYVWSVAFSPDGTHAISGGFDNTLILWDVKTAQVLHKFVGHSKTVKAVVFSPDGAQVLSGSFDKTIKLWDVSTGRLLRTLVTDMESVNSVAFSPDGAWLLSADDKTAKLWDAVTGKLLRTFAESSVQSVAFSPDGTRVLSGSMPDSPKPTVKLWDAATGRLLRSFDGQTRTVWTVAFSRDGAMALSGADNKTINLWDVSAGQLLRTFTGHAGQVQSVAFSPDGARIVSAGDDSTIRIWSAGTGQTLVSFLSSKDGEWLAITPEGFFVASKKGADLLSVVRGFEVYSIDQVFQALYRPDLVREKLAGDPKGLVREAAAKLDLDKVIASGSAPAARLIAPREGQRVATEEITAEAELTDRGGGIGRIEWRVNGVTLGVDTRGLGRPSSDSAKTITVRQPLTLDDGENVIEVVAYNAKELIASVPAALKITREGAQAGAPPRLYGLTVGVNDYYDGRLKLTFAAPDATALADALQRAGEKIYERTELKTVLDADVSIANLDKIFAELSQRVRAQDVFVFFIAGHGKTVDGRYYFLPQDFRYQGEESIVQRGIGQERWQEWFARIRARKSILLYDTCESGTLTGDRVAQRGLERVAALDRLTQAMGRTVLTASTDDAPALEGYRGHGVFTYALLDAFGRADTNRDGLIEVTGLAAYVDRQVPELSFKAFHIRQVPQMRIVGSNFPLANRIAVLPAESDAAAAVISTKPTHAVNTAAQVFADIGPGSAPVRKLSAGMTVTLVKTEAGWSLIAREGKVLGYVATSDLLPLQ
ncbi:MAG: caspase family protein [Xanthobacteraceae bacterium]